MLFDKKIFIDAGVDEPIFMVDAAGNRYYYFYDGLGSVAALSNANNEIVEQYRYSVFGQTHILSANYELRTTSLFGNRFMFTGREYDSETGLYYYRGEAKGSGTYNAL